MLRQRAALFEEGPEAQAESQSTFKYREIKVSVALFTKIGLHLLIFSDGPEFSAWQLSLLNGKWYKKEPHSIMTQMSKIKLYKTLKESMTKNGRGWLRNLKLAELYTNGTCIRACAEANYFKDAVTVCINNHPVVTLPGGGGAIIH